MTAKRYNAEEIAAQLHWLEHHSASKNPDHDFAHLLGIIKQLQSDLAEAEEELADAESMLNQQGLSVCPKDRKAQAGSKNETP